MPKLLDIIHQPEGSRLELQHELENESLYGNVLRLVSEKTSSTRELSSALGQKSISGQLKRVLMKLRKDGLVEWTEPGAKNQLPAEIQDHRTGACLPETAESQFFDGFPETDRPCIPVNLTVLDLLPRVCCAILHNHPQQFLLNTCKIFSKIKLERCDDVAPRRFNSGFSSKLTARQLSNRDLRKKSVKGAVRKSSGNATLLKCKNEYLLFSLEQMAAVYKSLQRCQASIASYEPYEDHRTFNHGGWLIPVNGTRFMILADRFYLIRELASLG